MSLRYAQQDTFPIIGSKDGTTTTASALTTAYTGNTKTFKVALFSKLNLDIEYNMGATETGNSIEVQVEGSPDGVNFYRIPNESVSAGTSTLTAREFTFVGTDADTATVSIGLDIFYRYVKVSIKESGVVTNAGTAYVEATISGQ